MNIHHTARHIGVAGKSGTGKSTYVLRYLAGSHHSRVFIFDHQGEYSERLKVEACYTVDDLQARIPGHRFICYDPSVEWGGRFQDGFNWFCEMVYNMALLVNEPKGQGTLFVCDELQKFVSDKFCPMEFQNMVETGRKVMLDTISASQRPNKINGNIREQFTELVLFRLDDENSLKFAADVGADIDAVRKLPRHHWLFYNVLKGDERTGNFEFAGRGAL